MPRSVIRPKIRDIVVERLKSYIAAAGLVPGDRLPTETALAAQFGVSRPSLREATKSLELLGILESKTGVGLTVGAMRIERLAGHLGFHPAIHRASPTQLIHTRIIVETGALPYVARRMSEDATIYAELLAIVDRFRGTRDLEAWIALDISFHRLLLESSGLSPLVAFHDLLQIFFQKFRESVKLAQWRESTESHQRLIDDLRAGEVARAIEELRAHIESHERRMEASP
jgi:GntR family transcriptional repressor for pyruvate dehydrogenase complex